MTLVLFEMREYNYLLQVTASLKGLWVYEGLALPTPLLVPILSGLQGPRSRTIAFSRCFLACRTLGVPSEHGPLLSHLSVNKQSRGTHSPEGPHGAGSAPFPEEGTLLYGLIREGRTVRTPPPSPAATASTVCVAEYCHTSPATFRG